MVLLTLLDGALLMLDCVVDVATLSLPRKDDSMVGLPL